MNKSIIFMTICALLAGVSVTSATAQTEDAMNDDMVLSGDVEIATLNPITGESASTGIQTDAAAALAVNDFNNYLDAIGQTWQFVLTREDNASSPTISFEKIQSIKAKGIDIIIGPTSSGVVSLIKPYADVNNMMLISCCSTSPELAIADDSVYRMVQDDTIQGKGVAKLLEASGFETMVPIWRGDSYGNGLVGETRKSFEERGFISYDGIQLSPGQKEFSAEVAFLADQVQTAADEYGQDKVAVFMVEFDNAISLMQTAADYDILSSVQWYTAEGFVSNPDINDPIVREFTDSVKLTGYLPDVSRDDYRIKLHLADATGIPEPTTFVYAAYDAVWLVGLSIAEAQSAEVSDIKAVIHEVAANMRSSGAGSLNEAGDLALGNYVVYKTEGGQWVPTGERYVGITDTIDLV